MIRLELERNMPSILKTLLLSSVLFLLTATVADARSTKAISKNKAVATATSQYPGKVVKISGGKQFYQIRVLQKNGRVVTVKVDKKSGRILKGRKKGR